MPRGEPPRQHVHLRAVEGEPADRGSYKVVAHPEFTRSASKLDPTIRAQADAEFHEFVRIWKRGVAVDELKPRWDYKHLSGKDAGEVGLRQVRVLKQRRVLLVLTTPEPRMWLLDIFTKTSESVQKAAIARAVTRARKILRGTV